MKSLTLRLAIFSMLVLALMPLSALVGQEDANGLTGSQWQLASYGVPGEETPALDENPVTIQFGPENQVGGSGGCNTYGGNYAVDGDTITFTQIVSTLIACLDDGVMEQEQAYFTALQEATGYELSDDRLIIIYGEGQQLVFVPAETLSGSQWALTAYGAAGEETPILPETRITLEFGDDNQAAGTGGCNAYNTSYTVDSQFITFSAVVSTRMACAEESIMEQEQAYFNALQAATTYKLISDQLVITYGESQQLIFSRVNPLSETQWQLESYGVAGEETPVVADSAVTLAFDVENAAGSGGCNSYSTSYTLDRGNITFSEIVSTLMACADDLMAQEQAYFDALQTASSYELAEGQLVIAYGDGQRLIFTQADAFTDSM